MHLNVSIYTQEDISFDASDSDSEEELKKIIVTDDYVKSKIGDVDYVYYISIYLSNIF
jgi:hypothetical protein